MKHKLYLTAISLLVTPILFAQSVLKTDKTELEITTEGNKSSWNINFKDKTTTKEIEIRNKKAKISISDGKNAILFTSKRNQNKTIQLINSKNDTVFAQIKVVEPNVTFSKEYVAKHQGKTVVEIPEVSELVNVLMSLHKDAEKDSNMFDTQTDYYKRIKKHFAPHLNHPALDTIQKYITKPELNEKLAMELFPMQSYVYYYALKMNACAYEFDNKGNIKNKGYIKQIAKNWSPFDPMKDAEVFADFAKKSNFRDFYKENQNYYQELISTYNKLNPIQQMQTWLDKKFGFGYGSYIVYFSPLINGAHSTVGFDDNGLSQTFMFIARAEYDKEETDIQNEIIVSRVVFTEIDHNYVNPLSYTMLEEINFVFSDREKWAKGEVTQAYSTPYKVFNEYMTFAVYSLYINDHYAAEEVNKYLPTMEDLMQNTRGFIRFKDFNRTMLKKYQENPNISMKNLHHYMLEYCKNS